MIYLCATQRISNREFKLWTIHQGTDSREPTSHAEIREMSRQTISCHATKL